MLARRRDSGALAIYDLITGMASDGDGGLRALSPGEQYASYVTVSEFMIQANSILAGWRAENDVPVPFRAHQAAATASARHDLLSDLTPATGGQAEQWRRDGARTRPAGMLRPAVNGSAWPAGELICAVFIPPPGLLPRGRLRATGLPPAQGPA